MTTDIAELCERYKKVYSPAITDALDRRGLRQQWLGPEIRPLKPGMVVAGEAYTVQWASSTEYEVPGNSLSGPMLEGIYAHCVVVMDTARNPEVGYWGELCCNLSLSRNVAGAVIDGGIRDADYIMALGFPIFGRFTSPIEAATRSKVIAFQQPIRINGVAIDPGDLVFGDMGGIVIVPKAIAREVIAEVEEIVQKEDRIRLEVRQGTSLKEVLNKYKSF